MGATAQAPNLSARDRVTNWRAARRRHGARADLYLQLLTEGDPLADTAAAALADCVRPMAIARRAIRGDCAAFDELPTAARAALRDWLAAIDQAPPWLDRNQIDRGARAYMRHGPAVAFALYAGSLISGYANPATALPLVMTGRFVARAERRLVETARWLFAASRPGGMERGAEGFALTAEVRLIHAFARRAILASGGWDASRLGMPISAGDNAFGIVEFSYVPLEALRRLGFHFRDDELRDVYALWRYIGHVLGVDPRVHIPDHREAAEVWHLVRSTSHRPDETGRALTRALLAVDFGGPRWARQLRMRIAHGCARAMLGREVADALELGHRSWRWAPRAVRPFIARAEDVRRLVPAADPWLLRRSLRAVDRAVAEMERAIAAPPGLAPVDSAPAPAATAARI